MPQVDITPKVWTVPVCWPGERAFIIGGGPSLTGFDPSVLRGKGRVIATNSAYRIAPWADALIWMDYQWYMWNRHELHLHTGEFKVTTAYPEPPCEQTIHFLKKSNRTQAISRDPQKLTGFNTGHQAMNLAVLMGVTEIILLGFDLRSGLDGRSNWHNYHKNGSLMRQMIPVWIADFERASRELEGQVTVWQTNPASALTCFPHRELKSLIT